MLVIPASKFSEKKAPDDDGVVVVVEVVVTVGSVVVTVDVTVVVSQDVTVLITVLVTVVHGRATEDPKAPAEPSPNRNRNDKRAAKAARRWIPPIKS